MTQSSKVTIDDPGAEAIARYTDQIIAALTENGRRTTARVAQGANPDLIRNAVRQAFYAGAKAEADARDGGGDAVVTEMPARRGGGRAG